MTPGAHAMSPAEIAAAFAAACRDELIALKPGNVHRFAGGHRMTVADFEASAAAAAPAIAAAGAAVGARILAAVEATVAAAGTNTNLGIVLLCAPLARAAEMPAAGRPPGEPESAARAAGATAATGPAPAGWPPLRERLAAVLAGLDVDDAAKAFRAIALANPAGLGKVEAHDVAGPATVTLAAAMAAAAGRDRVARQYATDYEDVFSIGLPTLAVSLARHGDRAVATTAVHLAFLAAFPDSHIARKHGPTAAAAVQGEAAALVAAGAAANPPGHHAALLAFDAALKARGLNPGTTADLTVATLFADRLGG